MARRVRRAAPCFALIVLFLLWAVHKDAPDSTSTVRSLPANEQSSASQPRATPTPGWAHADLGLTTAHGRLPQAFIENPGQVDERARLYLTSERATLWLTNEGAVFDLLRVVEAARAPTATPAERRARRSSLPQERLIFSQDFRKPSIVNDEGPIDHVDGTHEH